MSDLELYEARSGRRGGVVTVVDVARLDDEIRQEELDRNATIFAARYEPKPVAGLSELDRSRMREHLSGAMKKLREALQATPKTNMKAGGAILDAMDLMTVVFQRIGSVV